VARQRRFFVSGVTVHVIKRGNNRASVFSCESDYERFLHELGEAATAHDVAVHAYVLMTNHVHVMMTPDRPRSISSTMKQLGERYSRYFNGRYDRIGTPWSGRYRGLLITDERYWLTCLRYIEQNPVRAGMVVAPSDYQWSSYAAHALGRDPGWLKSHPVFDGLGRSTPERAETYRQLCSATVSSDDVRRLRYSPRRALRADVQAGDAGSDPGV